jgi:hypothetical protein
MNDLDPLLPSLVPHVKITNKAPCQRERDHTVADCVVHFSSTSALGQGVTGIRLQNGKQIFCFVWPSAGLATGFDRAGDSYSAFFAR